MASYNVKLKNANGDYLFPQTYWGLVLDKPTNLATTEQLALKQNILTTQNAGTNVTITTEGGVLKINAVGGGVTSYNALTDKPSLESYTLEGTMTAHGLGLALLSDIPTAVSQLTNDVGYITNAYHDSSKQNNLTTENAGDNITITTVGGVLKINAITGSGGTSDYEQLSNRPTLTAGSQTAVFSGAYTLGSNLSMTANKTINVTGIPNIIITENNGFIISAIQDVIKLRFNFVNIVLAITTGSG